MTNSTRLLVILFRYTAYLGLLTGVAASYAGGARHTADSDSDHLVPSDNILNPDYYTLLSRKLFVTPSNFVRVVDLSSAVSESSFAIYLKLGGSKEAFITYTEANENLWYAGSDEQFRFTKDPRVKIVRIDASFPYSLAVSVSEAIKRQLSQTRPPVRGHLVTVHGRAIEFSIKAPGAVTVRGLLPPYAQGKDSDGLRQLVDLLKKYCQVGPVERTELHRRIENEVRRL